MSQIYSLYEFGQECPHCGQDVTFDMEDRDSTYFDEDTCICTTVFMKDCGGCGRNVTLKLDCYPTAYKTVMTDEDEDDGENPWIFLEREE